MDGTLSTYRANKSSVLLLFFTLLLVLIPTSKTYADGLILQYPGSGKTFTWGVGINNLDQAVGYFTQNCVDRDCNGGVQGFLYSNGSFSSVNVPGSPSTYANGINDLGEIVGSYADLNTGFWGGFVDSGNHFTTVSIPGAYSTSAMGINDTGEIVGTYSTIQGNTLVNRGFIDVGGSYTSLSFPGATQTEINGINNLGVVIGSYSESGPVQQPFIYTAGQYYPINVPGMADNTVQGFSINDLGYIVGDANDSGSPQAFLYADGNFQWLSAPGAYETIAGGINDTDTFIGSDYYADDVAAYLADPAPILTPEPSSLTLFVIGFVLMLCGKRFCTAR